MAHYLNKKLCLITGAASGIGRACARLAAKEGALLCLCDVNAEGLKQVVSELNENSTCVLFHQSFDISNYQSVQAFAEQVHQRHGSVDIVMNVAGISTWGSIEQLKHEHWQQLVDINLMGPIHILECFVPEMIKAKRGGHIVNVSSAAGLLGLPLHAAYSATKFGLRGISEVLRFDLRQHHISVSLVCPGAVNTGLVQSINIVGVDKENTRVKALTKRFQSHAVAPEIAARIIFKGMSKKRYMIFTSWDIWAAYWLQGKIPIAYEWVMRFINWQAMKVLKTKGG